MYRMVLKYRLLLIKIFWLQKVPALAKLPELCYNA